MPIGNPRCEHCGWVYGQPHYPVVPYRVPNFVAYPMWDAPPVPDPSDDYSI